VPENRDDGQSGSKSQELEAFDWIRKIQCSDTWAEMATLVTGTSVEGQLLPAPQG